MLVKPLISAMAIAAVAWVISMFHPFDLAMPWQTGDSTSVNRSLQQIMSGSDLELLESDWGRTTPFNYVAADAVFAGTGQPSTTCSDLRDALDAWGGIVDNSRNPDGCNLEAVGPGPMTANITLVEIDRRQLRVEVRVQHAP